MSRAQLLGLGFKGTAIDHRLRRGRLHRLMRGVYAVGRPEVSRLGWLSAALLRCGPEATLSHGTAAEVWNIRRRADGPISVTVPRTVFRDDANLAAHRRQLTADEMTTRDGLRVTSIVLTLIDLAATLNSGQVEAAISEADKQHLIRSDELPDALDRSPKRRGLAALRRIVGSTTFRLTDSELERRFLALLRRAGLPMPVTGAEVNGYRVDFHWPDLGLVVETDGLRYHRTPQQQARDRLRDQTHAAQGLATLRFTHAQVAQRPGSVAATVRAVVRRLEADTREPGELS